MLHLACLLTAIYATAADEAALSRFRFTQVQMGMPFELTLYAADEVTANRAAEAAFARIAELNSILSDYDPNSELSRLSDTAGSGQAVKLSDPLWTVLQAAQSLSQRTDGAFDVTVGPLVKLWRRARRQKELPDADRLAAARQAVGYRYLQLDATRQTARLTQPTMRLDLGGIGAGYAVDEAVAVLKRHGITRAMVNASGDIGVADPPPDAKGWRIGIAPLEKPDGEPSQYLQISNSAVTTSGDAFQFVEIEGRRYSHIVDPRTGLGLGQQQSVTVIAPTCMAADSLATAVCLLGGEAGLKLIEDTPDTAALLVTRTHGALRVFRSRCLQQFLESK